MTCLIDWKCQSPVRREAAPSWGETPDMRGVIGMLSGGRKMPGRNAKHAVGLLFFPAERAVGLLFFPANGLGEHAIHH